MIQAAEDLTSHRLDFTAIGPDEWNAASRRSHPEPGKFAPDAAPLVPLFERATVSPPAPGAEPAPAQGIRSTELYRGIHELITATAPKSDPSAAKLSPTPPPPYTGYRRPPGAAEDRDIER